MNEYAKYNAENVLENVNKCIAELENVDNSEWDHKRLKRTAMRKVRKNGRWDYDYKSSYAFYINAVCDELSIFDWWNETLSVSQLKQMKAFLQTAIKLGFKGYVCFKVGASGCAHGMWAHQMESKDGYSPDDDEILFHSFRSGDNYWGVRHKGVWDEYNDKRTLEDVKKVLNDECRLGWIRR